MIEIALAGLIASAGLSPSAARPEPMVQQVQIRGCGDGYDYNYSDGRCYPNGQHAPGVYDNRGGYGDPSRRGCGDGYDYNYSDGRCYPNSYHAPGVYDSGPPRRRRGCGDGYDYNYSDGRCYPNGYHAPGLYAR
ncbi:hypothetical protein AYJ54_08275 [Bradyrhizobium centrolobii]|uniref:Uncharacterized protein n=1 Tax=Bradyrhizobium centrolobii TaxID=1505087 RepID=A0A176YVU2_9BRAD|nr:hypothetical protein [Bradyrhizobium centrolobii]OAF11830.1 hypothetical protein AYJ54_08275 [Bradyrhizobium centrolobii]